VEPVWATEWGVQLKTVNVSASLRRVALSRYKALVANKGSSDAALDMLFWESRGRAAHADRSSLEYDSGFLVAEQLLDATLLQYAARVAIESSQW